MHLDEKLWQTIGREKLFAPGSTVLVGCSGGADSVSLLLLLREMSLRHRLDLRLHVAHLNHMIRGAEADEDQAFVERLAASFALPCHVGRVDVPARSRERTGGLEEVARDERYSFLQRLAEAIGAARVAVGHTADDQAEPILGRLFRGAGLQGLRGMALRRPLGASRVELVRPLLFLTHQELLDYLTGRGQEHRLDSTNLVTDYTRNRIRHELLPLLESRYSANIRPALVRLSTIAGEAQDYLEAAAAAALEELTMPSSNAGMVIACGGLGAQPPAIRRQVVRLAIRRVKGHLRQVSAKDVDKVLRLAAESSSGRAIQLSHGLRVLKEHDTLRFQQGEPAIRPGCSETVELAIPGATPLPERGFEVRAEALDAAPGFLARFRAQKTLWEEALDLAALALPLRLRSWQAGDRFRPLGAAGTKKLQDLFTDRKVPRERRGSVPVVADGRNHPVWVVGFGIAESVKIQETTARVLRIQLLPLGDVAGLFTAENAEIAENGQTRNPKIRNPNDESMTNVQ